MGSVMHVNVREILTVMKTVTELTRLLLRLTLGGANSLLLVLQGITATVILTVMEIVTVLMQPLSSLISGEVLLETPARPALWENGAVIKIKQFISLK
jgi:hypothetical protein